MMDKIFSKDLDQMEPAKKDKCNNSRFETSTDNKNSCENNSHEFKLSDRTQNGERKIKSPTYMILQVDCCIKIQLSKKIFVYQEGKEKKEKYKNCSRHKEDKTFGHLSIIASYVPIDIITTLSYPESSS